MALKLRKHYKEFAIGFISFPFNIPGTAYHAALKGRKNVLKVIKKAFKERRWTKKSHDDQQEADFVDRLLMEVINEVVRLANIVPGILRKVKEDVKIKGADFAKLQMAIFLRHLLTKYRWKVKKEGKIIRQPALMFREGLCIQIRDNTKSWRA
ncbi:hypothetical protein ACH5RR_000235 [Cinchona calisaya]|uniref:Uncharacterized protein n=1 Tax=Cinchona calisaya TaxID=153742 RepID=A0ABD3B107_9GENT